MFDVEVVYAPLSAPMVHLRLMVLEGATVKDVLHQSGVLVSHPETCGLSVGIFSKLVDESTLVQSGSRIEIYRSLLIDPMEKRRERAKKKLTVPPASSGPV